MELLDSMMTGGSGENGNRGATQGGMDMGAVAGIMAGNGGGRSRGRSVSFDMLGLGASSGGNRNVELVRSLRHTLVVPRPLVVAETPPKPSERRK